MRLILASRSPRRRQLLSMAGISFETAPSNFDEESLAGVLKNDGSGISERALAERLALAKARAVLPSYPEDLILAADTIVTLDGALFGKPKDRAEARKMLRTLAGQTHRVDTGVALISSLKEEVFSTRSEVTFRPLSSVIEALIDDYVRTDLPLDKAGGYGIQELGGLLIERIEGDFFSVMGLPIGLVYERLQAYRIQP
ncbi:MAG TPA: nucleoside triphosphate pyrophosphatase [Bacillota bacterium]|jgi:septum formation protein|nr:septum formation protein Maf [Fastidiosipila sp.]HPX93055.1 nucleoside triphosphate pyrophosphatase [Bacillota bacterium]HQB80872.1 nucleoside triphosphate pyrophosphatase [Bacillota bacterium]